MRWIALILVAGLLLIGYTACRVVPVTGRQQLTLVPPAQELELGLTAFEQMKKELPVSRDPAANALVQRVGQRIAAVAGSDLPDAKWEFVVFDDEQMNAFCLPGGKVGVYMGLLKVTQDEAGLATVIGHEVAHATARHGAERLSEGLALQLGGQVLGASLSSADPRMQMAATLAYGLGAQFGRALPHSRLQESEADHIGLIYMARAGYNPQAALDFWTRFAEATGAEGGPPWFLRTHPVTTDRIDNLRRLMPEAMAEFQRLNH